MKKLIISILCFLPLLLLLAGVNLAVDPANLLRADRVVDDIIAAMDDGLNADGISDFADRLLMARYIPAMERAPETVVLGSSRGAQIDTAIVGPMFNSCVSGATIEDIVAIYEIYAQNGLKPARYVISVDPWFFDKNKTDERWRLYLADYYDAFYRENIDGGYSGDSSVKGKGVTELFSPGYFQESVDALRSGSYAEIKLGVVPTDKGYTLRGMLRADGSYVYPRSYIEADAETVRARVRLAYEAVVGALETSGGIDPQKAALFEALLESMRADGAEVVLVKSPYHPLAYEDITTSNAARQNLAAVDAYIDALCARENIPLVGGYDPAALDFPPLAFLDALHLSYFYTGKLLEGYFIAE